MWITGNNAQLLFIFSTRISLTTITLHYYSDSDRGLSRLRFYVVPDDFDVWDAPATSYPHVGVAAVLPGGEPAGCRNISINVNFNTRKVLMYKFSGTFLFAVSEVEFFICKITSTCKYQHGQYHNNYYFALMYSNRDHYHVYNTRSPFNKRL